ncbi:hypothetical protein BK138_16195 [Paenibacillus rhizosphaerae]|uniref:Phage ABA sandwich domain-containing protein n=1 Tax=Paenibacillus rhizosphaerae TaxID=297318 RepID=A0A1R1ESC5_9BACL|nr:hypothetical protein [Paenibacillus rhizosphaerae]OMF54697.1 hypothetical protein BK138_16195 [Paenibacillus rhizosphaerae]
MTREEILSREDILRMKPGRELDAKVALAVMGFKEITVVGSHYFTDPIDTSLKSYSSDISAAWEVVEKMRTKHKQYITIIDNPHLSYDVRFSEDKSAAFVRLSSLPHAICRAALLAVMDKEAEA